MGVPKYNITRSGNSSRVTALAMPDRERTPREAEANETKAKTRVAAD